MARQTDLRTCERYRRNGDACTNPTERIDGWCHAPECDGFSSPHGPDDREPVFRAPLGTARHIAETRHVRLDVDVDEIDVVRVTRKAREQFVAKHGGDDRAAEVQIRQMLEDFLLDGARFPASAGRVKVSKAGYWLVLSPDHGTVTAYDTVHRERSWEQFKAGVPSRFKVVRRSPDGVPRRPAPSRGTAPSPEPVRSRGPAVPLGGFVASVSAGELHVTWRAIGSYAKLHRADPTDVDALSRALRADLEAALPTAEVAGRCDEHVVTLHAGEHRWVLSPDARAVIDVKRA